MILFITTAVKISNPTWINKVSGYEPVGGGTIVNTVMDFRVPRKAGKFLTK
jgi:hypothetical protein